MTPYDKAALNPADHWTSKGSSFRASPIRPLATKGWLANDAMSLGPSLQTSPTGRTLGGEANDTHRNLGVSSASNAFADLLQQAKAQIAQPIDRILTATQASSIDRQGSAQTIPSTAASEANLLNPMEKNHRLL